MPTHRNPRTANGDCSCIVHLQCFDGGATPGCEAQNINAFIRPGEVLTPFLCPGIEEGDVFLSDGINRVGLVRFIAITRPTGKPEICFSIAATSGFWDDMFDFEGAPDVFL